VVAADLIPPDEYHFTKSCYGRCKRPGAFAGYSKWSLPDMLHSYGRLEYCRKWHNLQLDCHASYWAMSGRHASANGIQPWDLLDSNVLCSQHAGYVSR